MYKTNMSKFQWVGTWLSDTKKKKKEVGYTTSRGLNACEQRAFPQLLSQEIKTEQKLNATKQ